jgi:salicylate hydroxylase
MLQYAAQGACQAVEDAVVLGGLIGTETGEFEQRFEKFNAERRERTGAIQVLARELGRQLYHPAGDAARARDEMLRGLSDDDLYDKVAWVHGTKAGDRG